MLKDSIEQLRSIIADYSVKINNITEDKWSYKPNPSKWSKKEILGHLIDSAQNNIRRFIVAQYEENPHIVYAQDNWVRMADYKNYNTNDLISLWVLLNKHICIILANTPEGAEKRVSKTEELHSIEWLAQDYNRHLLHHLHQVLDLDAVNYP